MKRVKHLVIAGSVGMILLFAGMDASAQSRREIERERERIERENRRYERQRRDRRSNRRQSVSRRVERQINNANFENGYHYGWMAGEYDRRRGKYNQSNVYRDTGTYPDQGDPTSSDYIYRQGYLQGYNDGFYGVRNY